MSPPVPRPLIAQAVVVLIAFVVFSGVLAIVGSSPTADDAEHAVSYGNTSTTPGPDHDLTADITPLPADDLPSDVPPGAGTDLSGGLVAMPTSAPWAEDIDPIDTPMPEIDTSTPDLNDMLNESDMLNEPEAVTPLFVATLTGTGSQSTEPFLLEPGKAMFDLRHDPPGDFEVRLMYAENERSDLLLENGHTAEEPVSDQILEAGLYYLNVTADGEWQIDVSEMPEDW